MADNPTIIREQGVRGRYGYHDVYAPGWESSKVAGGEGCACSCRCVRRELDELLEGQEWDKRHEIAVVAISIPPLLVHKHTRISLEPEDVHG